MLVAGALTVSPAPAEPSHERRGIYARPGDLYFNYGQKSCRQKVGLKTAQRYADWCREWATSRYPPCSVNNSCYALLRPVVARCEELRQAGIDYPGKGYTEMANCAEARRVFEPDQAEAERRDKAYQAALAQHPGKGLSDDEWQKLSKKLNAE